jgi:hypothetical protein
MDHALTQLQSLYTKDYILFTIDYRPLPHPFAARVKAAPPLCVSYTAAANTTGRPRSGKLTIALTDTPTVKKTFIVAEKR